MELVEALKKRRTHKDFDGSPISANTLRELLDCAMTAPNHRRNEPWRFIVILSEQIPYFWKSLTPGLHEAFPNKNEEFIREKKESTEKKLLKLGALVYVTCLKDPSPFIEKENYAACSCAIQNLMLAATDKNLGSYWSTGNIFTTEVAYQILNLKSEEEFIVGAIWLGKPTANPHPPQYENESKIRYWQASLIRE